MASPYNKNISMLSISSYPSQITASHEVVDINKTEKIPRRDFSLDDLDDEEEEVGAIVDEVGCPF